jgi:hypothetical protein
MWMQVESGEGAKALACIGWIETLNGMATLTVDLQENPLLSSGKCLPNLKSLQFDKELQYLLDEEIAAWLQSCDDRVMGTSSSARSNPPVNFLRNVVSMEQLVSAVQRTITEKQHRAAPANKRRKYLNIDDSSRTMRILADIDMLGWENVVEINAGLSKLVCASSASSSSCRHRYEVSLTEDYPRSAPHVTADLPDLIGFNWALNPSLAAVHSAVSVQVDKYGMLLEVSQCYHYHLSSESIKGHNRGCLPGISQY